MKSKIMTPLVLLIAVSLLSVSSVEAAPIGYSVMSDGDGHLYSIDLSTGAATDLGLVNLDDVQGLASVGSTLYGIGGTVDEFWDITTPPGSKVGDTGPRNGIDAGLAHDPTSGKMYNTQRADGFWLYEINIATGVATFIGSSDVAQPDGLAIDSSGVAYAFDGLNKDALYTVDLSTGALTLVGPLGVDLHAEVGLAFDTASQTLYGVTDTGKIYTIDRNTGTATFVADTLCGFEDLTIPVTVIEVAMDIKPGSCPNAFSLMSRGVLPVAVLGTEDFDVTTIDPETITLTREGFEDVGVAPIRWSYKDVATPFEGELCDCHDLDGDGILDLTLKFGTQELVETLELSDEAGNTISLTLIGNLKEEFDGTPIKGEDCIRVL